MSALQIFFVVVSIVTIIYTVFITPLDSRTRVFFMDVLRGKPYPKRGYWEVVINSLFIAIIGALILSFPIAIIMLLDYLSRI